MELELKHLAAYLPYGLKWKEDIHLEIHIMSGIIEDEIWCKDDIGDAYSFYPDSDIKPILRNLSDLVNEIEHNGEKFVPFEKLGWGNGTHVIPMIIKGVVDFNEIEKLLSWHFDVFGLIDAGLAVSYNDC